MKDNEKPHSSAEAAIKAEITKTFKWDAQAIITALNSSNLTIVTGPNGNGKSSALIPLLSEMITQSGREVIVFQNLTPQTKDNLPSLTGGKEGIVIIDEAAYSNNETLISETYHKAREKGYKVIAILPYHTNTNYNDINKLPHFLQWQQTESANQTSVIHLSSKRLRKDLATKYLQAYCKDHNIENMDPTIEVLIKMLPSNLRLLDNLKMWFNSKDSDYVLQQLFGWFNTQANTILTTEELLALKAKFEAIGRMHLSSTEELIDTFKLDNSEREIFNNMFYVDPNKYSTQILEFLRNIKIGQSPSGEIYKYPKLTANDLAYCDGQDIERATDHVRRTEIAPDYYIDVAQHFEFNRPYSKSIIRKEQEDQIASDLNNNKPVLIRGFWRIGKSTMLNILAERINSKDQSILITANTDSTLPLDEFKIQFGLYDIASFIANKDHGRREDIEEKIKQSQMTPFLYLEKWLEQRNETVFLGLDEIISYVDNPKILSYIADLHNLPHLKLAIVLHQNGENEEKLQEIFSSFSPHYLRNISLDETKKLINQGLENTNIRLTDQALSFIHEFTGGRPQEVNLIMAGVLSPFYGNVELKLVYDIDDIKKLTDSAWFSDFFYNLRNNYQRIIDLGLNNEQRTILFNILNSTVKIGDVEPYIIKPLLATNLVIENNGLYLVNGDFLRIYLGDQTSRR